MKILFLTWRDLAHPQAGGAEVYTEEVIFCCPEPACRTQMVASGALPFDDFREATDGT